MNLERHRTRGSWRAALSAAVAASSLMACGGGGAPDAGLGFDSIRGKDARDVLKFLNKPASSQIMAAHAQGYTPAQLQKIIAYLQQ